MAFRRDYRWDIMRGCVVFMSRDTGRLLPNQVSEQALADHFDFRGPADQCESAFLQNRTEIERLATIAVAEGQVNEAGGGSITSEWLEKIGYRRGETMTPSVTRYRLIPPESPPRRE